MDLFKFITSLVALFWILFELFDITLFIWTPHWICVFQMWSNHWFPLKEN